MRTLPMSTEPQKRSELVSRILHQKEVAMDRIEEMLARSERLRDVCDEHDTCVSAITIWRSAESTDRARIEEYETLAREIEGEIARLIEELTTELT